MNAKENIEALQAVIPSLSDAELVEFMELTCMAIIDDGQEGAQALLRAAITEHELRAHRTANH